MMDLSSNTKHMNVHMNANFAENIGVMAKGLSSINNNNNNNNNSSSNLSNLSQSNLFRPDNNNNNNNNNNNAGQAAVSTGGGENNNSKKIGGSNNNNNIIIASSGNNNNNNKSNSNRNNNNNNNNNNNGNYSSGDDVRYKECLRNHAANKGGYAVDGCGEFMPSAASSSSPSPSSSSLHHAADLIDAAPPLHADALKCAACGCHRNFHRREINGGSGTPANMGLLALPSPISANNTSTSNNEYGEGEQYHHHSNNVGVGTAGAGGFGHYNASGGSHHHHHGMGFLPHLHHHHHHQYMHAMMGSKLVQGGHGGHTMLGGGGHPYSTTSGGKRFRTKFTMEQREKMYEFSEKVGWRIQKQDEAAVQQFCTEAGVKRHVLKVWMHNNKNTFGKRLLRFPEAFNALPESSS